MNTPRICTKPRSRKDCAIGAVRVESVVTAAKPTGAVHLSASRISYSICDYNRGIQLQRSRKNTILGSICMSERWRTFARWPLGFLGAGRGFGFGFANQFVRFKGEV